MLQAEVITYLLLKRKFKAKKRVIYSILLANNIHIQRCCYGIFRQ